MPIPSPTSDAADLSFVNRALSSPSSPKNEEGLGLVLKLELELELLTSCKPGAFAGHCWKESCR